MRINLYHQGLHTLVLNGFPITGFSEGDWLEVKVDGGYAEKTQGHAGPVLNWVAEQGGTIQISLNPTSKALGDVIGTRNEAVKSFFLFNIELLTGTQETLNAAGCAFAELPSWRSGGERSGQRQFLINCGKIVLDDSQVKPIQGGMLGGLIPINI